MAGTGRLRRRAHRTLALVAAAAASVVMPLALALPASAHATLIGSDPVDGASLASAPTTVVLHFDEDILLASTHADIIDDTPGATVAAARPLVISGAHPGATARDVVAQLPTLQSGAYEVRWRAVSASDLHETHGTVVFGIGTDAGPSVTAADQWPSPWPTFFAWLQLAAFAVAAGSLAVAWLLLARLRADDDWRGVVRARLMSLALAAVLVAIAAGGGLLAVRAPALSGSALRTVLSGRYGRGWLVEQGALAAIALVLLSARGHRRTWRPSRALRVCVTVAATVSVLAQTLTSHLAASAGGSVAMSILACAHIVAAAIWVGAVVSLAACAPLLFAPRHRGSGLDLVRRFSWLAVPCVATLATSGLVLAGHQVVTVDALLFTHYGRVLLAKVALAAAVGALGMRNAIAARRPSLDRSRYARDHSFAGEGVVALLVVGLAAGLSNAKPARGGDYTPVASAPALPLNQQVDDLLVGLSLRPDRPGPNFVTVVVRNTRIPAPAPIAAVHVRYTSPGPSPRVTTDAAVASGDGTWTDSSSVLDRPGEWQVHVVVSRHAMRDVVVDASWQVLPHVPPFTAHTRVSQARLAPALDGAAIVIAGVGLAAYGFARRRRRSSARDVDDELLGCDPAVLAGPTGR